MGQLRATLHTRVRACDHYTSSTLNGGKGGAGPSSLHTTLEGPTKYMNAKMDAKSTWHRMVVFHGHLDYFQIQPLGGRPNTKPRYHGTLNPHNH